MWRKISKNLDLLSSLTALIGIIVLTVLVRAGVNYIRSRGATTPIIKFESANYTLPQSSPIKLIVDSGGNSLGFVRTEISFDNTKIRLGQEITTTPLFKRKISVTSMIDANTSGKIVIALGIDPTDTGNPPTGVSELAQLFFVPATANSNQSTVLSFSPATMQIVNTSFTSYFPTVQSSSLVINPVNPTGTVADSPSIHPTINVTAFPTPQPGGSGKSVYVSLTGSDSNPGTSAAPYRTFSKAVSVLLPGDRLFIYGGTYNERIKITQSGTNSLPITILPVSGQQAVIDMQNQANNLIDITGSYINISGIETKNSNGYCVNLTGTHILASRLIVHNCNDHGIYTDGQHNTISENTVYLASMMNQPRTINSGWGSGIKVRVGGDNITIKNNTVYHNYGEGIAVTRGINSVVQGNRAYDNYSVNIYIDNSHDVIVEKNFVTCSANTGFERNGNRPNGIALAEENYSGWGAQLARVNVKNNIVAFCNGGVAYWGSDVSGAGGLDTITIANNTFWGSVGPSSEIALSYVPYKTRNSIISNNIVGGSQKLAWIENRTGLTLSNNFWDPAPPDRSLNASGSNDKFGDVKFLSAPSYLPASYRLSSTSPAINGGRIISGITDDFESKPRSTAISPGTDIGAIEFQ